MMGIRPMIRFASDNFWMLMDRGGVVMWPLLGLSVLAMALVIERLWFWVKINHARRLIAVEQMARMLRLGKSEPARALAQSDGSIYGGVVRMLLDETLTDAVAVDVIQSQRSRLERFMPTLSTIITTAPMLGILGTVFGIISSFQILSDQTAMANPRDVGQGIAEALLTTAVGLVVAIGVLFPYNVFRAQIDRTLGRIESLVAAASVHAHRSKATPDDA